MNFETNWFIEIVPSSSKVSEKPIPEKMTKIWDLVRWCVGGGFFFFFLFLLISCFYFSENILSLIQIQLLGPVCRNSIIFLFVTLKNHENWELKLIYKKEFKHVPKKKFWTINHSNNNKQ